MDEEDGTVDLTDSEDDSSEEMVSVNESDGDNARECAVAHAKKRACDGFSVPRQLILPILLATMSQVAQWGLAQAVGKTGAMATDPKSCDGDVGEKVYRFALTSSQVMVPLGSVFSSVMPCPRSVFYVLSTVQLTAGALVTSAALGLLGCDRNVLFNPSHEAHDSSEFLATKTKDRIGRMEDAC